jgi:LmbE family N-acetylglucosaminyl deacetylase
MAGSEENSSKILEEMLRLKRELEPDVVFLPSLNDTHQDPQIVEPGGA